MLREPFAVLHSALLGMMALVLAFGLALAMGRYESRRAALVDETNAIGTTYLRAQTLSEPIRTSSLELLRDYTDTSIALSHSVPGSAGEDAAVAAGQKIQRELWGLADDALDAAPLESAPRLYVESLNEMIDMQTTRVATRGNRVPTPILAVEVFGAAAALGLLSASLDDRARDLRRSPGRAPRVVPDPRHVRSRPADARPDPRARHAAPGAPGLDGAATGRQLNRVQRLMTTGVPKGTRRRSTMSSL